MKNISILLFNFDIENTIYPCIDNAYLYTICSANSIEDVENNYNGYVFEIIFLKLSKDKEDNINALKYFKERNINSKITAVSTTPGLKESFYYTRMGADDFREMFKDFSEVMNILQKTQHNDTPIYAKIFHNIRNIIKQRTKKTGLFEIIESITNTSLICLLKSKGENETIEHLSEVGQYAKLICEKLKKNKGLVKLLTSENIEYMYLGCLLHDIGKINIPLNIIMKPSSLTKEEFEIIKAHSSFGYEMLSDIERSTTAELHDFFNIAKDIILHHHENYDGTGYPSGLRAGEIPFCARICTLADSYSALASNRPYRKRLNHKEICSIILEKQSNKYDPDILDVFHHNNNEFEEISQIFKKGLEISKYKGKKTQCAWCKSLFLFNKWMPYNEIIQASHSICPKCNSKIQESLVQNPLTSAKAV